MSFLTLVCLAFLLAFLILGILLAQDTGPRRHLMGHNQLGMPIYAPTPSYSPPSLESGRELFFQGCFLVGLAWGAYWLSGYWENYLLRLAAFAGAATMAVVGFMLVLLYWRTYCLDCRDDGKQPLLGAGTHILLFMIVMGLAVAGCVRGFMTGDRLWPVIREPTGVEAAFDTSASHDNAAGETYDESPS